MAIPPNPVPLRTYYDPSLWDRLAPALMEHRQSRAQGLIAGNWRTLEEAREIIGEVRAIDRVFDLANELTRIEE